MLPGLLPGEAVSHMTTGGLQISHDMVVVAFSNRCQSRTVKTHNITATLLTPGTQIRSDFSPAGGFIELDNITI